MKKDVRIVIVEDDPADASRLTEELRNGGISFRSKQVDNQDAFLDALENYHPDLVLSDHGLASFDGFAALELLQQRSPHIPLILISGSYDHLIAAELFERGATDYVYKGRLTELVPAVKDALENADGPAQRSPPVAAFGESPAKIVALPSVDPPFDAPDSFYLALCPECEQLTDAVGSPQRLSDHLATHPEARIISKRCPRCSYQFPAD